MTRVYEIPFHPGEDTRWPVRVDGVVVESFPSRYEALRAALNRAVSDGGDASIGIEGADGVWRPFGSDAKRPSRVPPLPQRHLSLVR
ncbi:DUF2188 domain-containing protein [Luteibacter anthropi]|uniref:DUF2188 domain-containing protein n=1 Tax=Luteibacter anthropi TaxID=564369 RepID=A0A7X5ZHS9_9GAMM|nr:DUF2188 domain-containing protein [Luteibacter anthropi]NII05915.1 DUF2188 domain-containing protein [Luteibacter anthropi]URX62431.1 DUF2188 domain-containing protein [Luteibacter anthropi]